MRPIYVFDRWGRMVSTIARPLRRVRSCELGKLDTLHLTVAGKALEEGQRIVFADRKGDWHEQIVQDPEDSHVEGELTQDVTTEDSINELMTIVLEEVEPQGVTASAALSRCLSSSRWTVGEVDVDGTASFSWYRTTVYEALEEIAEAFGGYLTTTVVVEGAEVVERKVNLLKDVGRDRGRLFVYGRNLAGVRRKVDPEDVYTAIYAFGKSVTTEAGGHSRKLDFADINGGKMYVADEEAKARYGLPDGKGGVRHTWGIVEFSDCEDQRELLGLALAELEVLSKPRVTYTADAVSLAEGGIHVDDIEVGDYVQVRDTDLGVNLKTRIVKVSQDDLDASADSITFGTVEPTLTGKLVDQQQAVEDLKEHSSEWDATSETVENLPGSWLQKQMDRINEEMNKVDNYQFFSFEKGLIFSSVPLDAEGKPTKEPATGININGMGLRVARKTKDGDFDYESFVTGEGVTANLINAGKLQCGDNFLNLDTGEMRIAVNNTTVEGGQSLDWWVTNEAVDAASGVVDGALMDYVPKDGFDSFLDLDNVFKALTRNGQDKGLFIGSDGAVAINADIIKSGVIASRDNQSFFNLDAGYLEATGRIYAVGQYHTMRSRLVNGQIGLKMDETDIGIIATFTQAGDANYHALGVKAFTNLVFSAPSVSVAFDSTVTTSLNWTPTVANDTLNFLTGATVAGGTLTLYAYQADIRHGMITAMRSRPNVTFSTATMRDLRLVASLDDADTIRSGESRGIRTIGSKDDLDEATAASKMVWALTDDGTLGVPVYTGSEWTMGEPTEDEPSEPVAVDVVRPEYVDSRVAELQAEIEALAAAVGVQIDTGKE